MPGRTMRAAAVVSASVACEQGGISPRRCAIDNAASELEERYSEVAAAGVPDLKKERFAAKNIQLSRPRQRGLPQDGPCAQDHSVHQLTGSLGGIAHAQSFDKHPCNGALCTSSGSLSVVPAQIMNVSTKRVIWTARAGTASSAGGMYRVST